LVVVLAQALAEQVLDLLVVLVAVLVVMRLVPMLAVLEHRDKVTLVVVVTLVPIWVVEAVAVLAQ
jgi:hypothetical protein